MMTAVDPSRSPFRQMFSGGPRGGSEYFYAIDLMRGLAALIVVTFHYRSFFVPPGDIGPEAGFRTMLPMYRFLWPLYDHGQFAVQLFWLISGFVFTAVYAARSVATSDFVVSRFGRLYPVHFLTLMIVAGLQYYRLETLGNFQIYQENDIYHFLLQLAFASNWGWERGFSFNGPIWSVSIEVLIYAIFWIVLPYIYKTGVVGPAALAILFSTGSFLDLPGTVFWQCGFYFFSGSAIYIVFSILRGQPVIFFTAGIAAVVAVAATLSLQPALGIARLMPVLLPGIFMIVCGVEATSWGRHARWTRWIGDGTYGIYLWHVPLQLIVLLVVDSLGISWTIFAHPISLALFLPTVFLIGRVSYLYVEHPARILIRRWWGLRRGAHPA